MSVEAWIIEETENEERRRREEQERAGVHLPRTPDEMGPEPRDAQRAKASGVEVVDLSPPPADNVIDL